MVSYSLTIDFADGNIALFAPLTGLTVLPCAVTDLAIKKQCPTLFKMLGFLFCLGAVVAASIDTSELFSDEGTMVANTTTTAIFVPLATPHSIIERVDGIAAAAGGNGSIVINEVDRNSNFEIAIGMFCACFVLW